MMQRLMTIPQFCRAYGVCRTTAYKLIKDGKIERVKVGRAARIVVETADLWFASLRALPEPEAEGK